MKFKLFNSKIEPSCSYCKHGRADMNGEKVFCEKRGIVDAYGSCRKFCYDPLKRIPKKVVFCNNFSKNDLEI